MTPEDIAQAIADALDGAHHEGGFWTVAHTDSDPASVWIEANNPDTEGDAGTEFRLTVESQP